MPDVSNDEAYDQHIEIGGRFEPAPALYPKITRVNYLLLFPAELSPTGHCAELLGERALYACNQHELQADLEIRVVVLNKGQGKARVVSVAPDLVRLELQIASTLLPRTPIRAVVGVARPQTVKKVLQFAGMVGFEALYFVRAERSIRSYLSSKPLQDSGQLQELYKALEQSGDWRLPQVEVRDSFTRFITEDIDQLLDGYPGFVASTRCLPTDVLHKKWRPGSKGALIAIGPEAGWTLEEVEALHLKGLQSVSLGERCFRVETALSLIAGQLQLLLDT